jgi:hypothetical protein
MVKVLVGVESDRLLPSKLTLIARHEVNKFAEDCNLRLEFNTVDDALEDGRDNMEVSKLNAQKRNIHENDEGGDGGQMIEQFAGTRLKGGAQDADGLDVN